MTEFLQLYVIKTLIPIAFIGIGILLGRNVQRLDDRSFSAVCLFAVAPFWFFRHSLSQLPFSHEFIFVLFFVVFHTGALFLIAYKIFQYLDVSPRILHLFLMNTIIASTMALRYIQTFLSDPGKAAQTVNTIIFYYMFVLATLCVYLCDDERKSHEGISKIFKTPLIYALLGGLILAICKVEIPYRLTEAIDPLYNGANALALLLVGILIGKYVFIVQIADYVVLLPGLIAVLFFRLILSPALAILIAPLVTQDNVEMQRALIMSSGAPTGLWAAVLVSYYGKQNEKRFVALCVVLSTLLHFIALPILNLLVNAWFPVAP